MQFNAVAFTDSKGPSQAIQIAPGHRLFIAIGDVLNPLFFLLPFLSPLLYPPPLSFLPYDIIIIGQCPMYLPGL
jgi:hypothetical protein